jgi:hypothetical protein
MLCGFIAAVNMTTPYALGAGLVYLNKKDKGSARFTTR